MIIYAFELFFNPIRSENQLCKAFNFEKFALCKFVNLVYAKFVCE